MALYVASQGIRVNVYDELATGAAVPIRVITGVHTHIESATDVTVDPLGNLYSSQGETSKLVVLAPDANGDATPLRILNGNFTQMHFANSVAVDGGGNVYALNIAGPPEQRSITVYGPTEVGNVPPIRVITGIQVGVGNVNAMAIDRADNVYVSEDTPAIISVFAAGANGVVTAIRTISGSNTGLVKPKGMDFDFDGNLYVSNGPNVLVFSPSADGNVAPIRAIGGPNSRISNCFDVAVSATGEVYTGNVLDNFSPADITVHASGADGDVAPIRSISGAQFAFGGLTVDRPPVSQDNWRWCSRCEGLFFGGDTTPGLCPAGGGHDGASSNNYRLVLYPFTGEHNWRWCFRCEGLFFAGGTTTGTCPAGGGHNFQNSFDYTLQSAPGTAGQSNWRLCRRCQGLFFAGDTTSGTCPAGGGHDFAGSADFVLTIA